MVLPLVAAGVGLGVAGGVANYIGGNDAAKARQRALDRWRNRRRELTTNLETSQYGNVKRKQAALSEYLGTMPTDGQEMPVHTAGGELDLTKPAARLDPELAAIYQAQAGKETGVADLQSVAAAKAARRAKWTQALRERAGLIQAGQMGQDNQIVRDRQRIAEQLAENDVELNGASTPNSAYNWQLLGSLLSAGGNAGITMAGRG